MLNGIRLVCADKEGNVQEDTVTSGVGPEGQWRGSVICKENAGKPRFLSQFSLQAEESVRRVLTFTVISIRLYLLVYCIPPRKLAEFLGSP